MFYEESKINNLLNCQQCKKKYDEPRMLPCGYTICNACAHIIDCKFLYNPNKRFKCNLCTKEHLMQSKEFPINLVILKLMDEKPSEIYRSEIVENLKANIEDISIMANQLKHDFKNGSDRIKEHCSELRRKVQLVTEQTMFNIDKFSNEFISFIDKYEKERLISYEARIKLTTNDLNTTITSVNQFVNQHSEYIRKSKINDKEVEQANQTALNHIDKLKKETKDAESFIFHNKLLQFNINLNDYGSDLLGKFNLSLIDNTINFEKLNKFKIKTLSIDFSKFKAKNIEILNNENYLMTYSDHSDSSNIALVNRSKSTLVVDKSLENRLIDSFSRRIWSRKDLIIRKSKSYIAIQSLTNCFLGIYDYKLNLIASKSINHLMIGATESCIYFKNSDDYKNQLSSFNWNLNIEQKVGKFQVTFKEAPFYLSESVKQLSLRQNKYVWLDNRQLNILNESDGKLVSSTEINTPLSFEIDSKDCVIVNTGKSLCYFDINGQFLKEIKLDYVKQVQLCLTLDYETDELNFFDRTNLTVFY